LYKVVLVQLETLEGLKFFPLTFLLLFGGPPATLWKSLPNIVLILYFQPLFLLLFGRATAVPRKHVATFGSVNDEAKKVLYPWFAGYKFYLPSASRSIFPFHFIPILFHNILLLVIL
jgi:hypothetical protein